MQKSGETKGKNPKDSGHEEEREIAEILIEVCQSCKKHEWCTRHNEAKYQKNFEDTAAAIKALCPDVEVIKNKNIKTPAMGAFEITAAGHLIYSKIQSGLWPAPAAVAQRVQKFIEDYREGKDVSKYGNIAEKKYVPPKKEHTSSNFYSQIVQQETEKKPQKQQEDQEQSNQNQQQQQHQQAQGQHQSQQQQAQNSVQKEGFDQSHPAAHRGSQSTTEKKQSAGRQSQSEGVGPKEQSSHQQQQSQQQHNAQASNASNHNAEPAPTKMVITPLTANIQRENENLKEGLGKIDPYCKVSLGSEVQQTQPHENGGKNPTWNNPLNFNWKGENKIKVEIMEKNSIMKDEFLGEGYLTIANGAQFKKGPQTQEVQLTNNKADVGTVSIRYEFFQKQ